MRRSALTLCTVMVLPVWSLFILVRVGPSVRWSRGLVDSHLTTAESVVLSHALVLVVTTVLVLVSIPWGRARPSSLRGVVSRVSAFRHPAAWLSAAVAIAPTSATDSQHRVPVSSAPVGSVLSPALASGVLAHILRRRREQFSMSGDEEIPDCLTEEEARILASVRRMAIEYDVHSHERENDLAVETVNADVHSLLAGVERSRPRRPTAFGGIVDQWRIVVKVFGYPSVENTRGDTAEFRKRRSLELLTWLALNRDRQRRSAARTAMWDVDISDSTFSTVISDMRRALSGLDGTQDVAGWCPPTYSDEIPLNPSIVTDADLLEGALHRFTTDESAVDEVVRYLSWIRDVPFAGTAYSWADLDGTTTRLVIVAVDAATTVARWAVERDRRDVLMTSVAAGLRVMPGCEELLVIQEQLISATALRHVSRPRR